ncbi:MAG: HAD hydrolase-like protein [Oscillibacter sp.]|nr:HAD hydrolase-like protein [Oscillibacter sp.]
MYHTILFDLDGTLTDSKEGILKSLHYAFEKLGRPAPSDAILTKFIGPPMQDSFVHFCGYTPEEANRAIKLFRERYVPIGKFENVPAPGLPEMCADLKRKGYALALSSSKPEDMCLAICDRFGYAPSLEVITGSPADPGDWTKADVIRETLRRLNLTEDDKPEILMVGDRKFDVEGAKECGIDCVGVEFFGYAAPGELKEAGAVAVVKTAQELEQFILTH